MAMRHCHHHDAPRAQLTCSFLLVFVFIAALAEVLSPPVGATQPTPPQADVECMLGFPENFYVSTGTTIPLVASSDGTATAAPVAQSGSLYVDGAHGRVRMDQFYMGRQHTFLTDRATHRAYVFHSGPTAGTSARDEAPRCHVFATVGDTIALCVPRRFTHDTTGPHLVRGVPVQRFHGYDRQEGGSLLQIDHYVWNASRPRGLGGEGGPLLIPWRMQTRERPAAELPEIAGAPLSMPNWRYFGQPMFDEVDFPLRGWGDTTGATAAGEDQAMSPYSPESGPVTVDFYNFVPSTPDAAVFTVPEACREAEEAWSATQASSEDGGEVDEQTAAAAAAPLGLGFAHRLLIDWSVSLNQQREH